jgi:hypothetical protein
MKETRIKINIKKPINEVFEFITNPANTPKWIPGIKEETSTEYPPKINTIYKNTEFSGGGNEYVVSTYEYPNIFQIDAINFDYKLKYTCHKISENETEFEYHEWSESGNLHSNEMQSILENLKKVLENK